MKPVNTFLVPDVSGEGTSAILQASRASAAAMGSLELVARTVAEIAGVWTLTWLVTSIVRSLCDRAGRVSDALTACCLQAIRTHSPLSL